MRQTFISVRLSVAEAEKLIAFAEKHSDDWCSGHTPVLANGIGKINDARKRLVEREREYRRLKPGPIEQATNSGEIGTGPYHSERGHLASCIFVNGRRFCAADCPERTR